MIGDNLLPRNSAFFSNTFQTTWKVWRKKLLKWGVTKIHPIFLIHGFCMWFDEYWTRPTYLIFGVFPIANAFKWNYVLLSIFFCPLFSSEFCSMFLVFKKKFLYFYIALETFFVVLVTVLVGFFLVSRYSCMLKIIVFISWLIVLNSFRIKLCFLPPFLCIFSLLFSYVNNGVYFLLTQFIKHELPFVFDVFRHRHLFTDTFKLPSDFVRKIRK